MGLVALGSDGRLPTLPALDGIRALAIAGVVFYHGDIFWVPGGLVGVEVFFVLSGYLITSLLWSEIRTTGRMRLADFLRRRARRLLPALFVMIGLVSAAFVAWWPSDVARMRGDVAAAASYTSNWYLIQTDQSYFESFARPSPFGHLWSLAIEEQFYLLWPLGLAFLFAWRRRARRIAGVVGLGAALSAGAMWLLYSGGDPSRVYYGTDTRASALLIGAALALVWHPFTNRERVFAAPPWLLDAATIGAAGTIVWAMMRFEDQSSFMYRPGLLFVALATAVLIAACVHPAARVGRVFGNGALRAIGRRSYSIYLWYWPVFVVTRPGVDVELPTGIAFAVRVAIVLALAELSFRYVEEPVRNGALGRIAERVRERWRAPGPVRPQAALALSFAITGSFMLAGSVATAVVRAEPSPLAGPATGAASPGRLSEFGVFDQAELAPPVVQSVGRQYRYEVAGIGDSVMAGARRQLRARFGLVPIYAAVGWHTTEGIQALERLRAEGRLSRVVVVHLGNNGQFLAKSFDRIMRVASEAERVVFVTVKVPRRWEASVNNTIAAGVQRYGGRAVLVDWRRLYSSCGSGVFARDGMHLTDRGAACYARLIDAAV